MIDFAVADFFAGAVDAVPVKFSLKTKRIARPKTLRPIYPNVGIQASYRASLLAMITDMHDSTMYWLNGSFNRASPLMAADELSSSSFRRAMQRLSRRWLKKFDLLAINLAKYFATSIANRSDAALKKMLKEGGFTIDWTMTAAQRDVLNAVVAENVSLIKSIPRQYLGQVEGVVMRGVQSGYNMKQMSDELQTQFNVTKKRAGFIARDQSSKTTAMLTRVRQVELGITTAIWIHSTAGRTKRRSHVANNGKEYDIKTGWYDPDEKKFILPGQLINCGCICKSIIPAFADINAAQSRK